MDTTLISKPIYVKCVGRPDCPFLSTQNTDGIRSADLWTNVDSMRQVWRFDPTPGGAGTYTIRVLDGGARTFLSVGTGRATVVDLFDKDDGSGRQRFLVRPVPGIPRQFTILASGLGRDPGAPAYLSAWAKRDDGYPARDIVLYDRDDGTGRQRFTFEAVSTPTPSTAVPPEAVRTLATLANLTELQIDTIQKLVACPENGSTNWENAYGFAKRLGDGRGITFGIVGFCSGTGDGVLVLEELSKRVPNHRLAKYIPAMKKTKGDNCAGLNGFEADAKASANDVAYREAQWHVATDMYWQFAADYAKKQGRASSRPGPAFSTPLAIGTFFDVALNHGAEPSSFAYITNRMKSKNATDGTAWLIDFLETRRAILRSGYQDLDTSGTGDRCGIWKKLINEKNWNLDRPIVVSSGYWNDDNGNPRRID